MEAEAAKLLLCVCVCWCDYRCEDQARLFHHQSEDTLASVCHAPLKDCVIVQTLFGGQDQGLWVAVHTADVLTETAI